MPDSATVERTDAELIAAVLGGDTASFEPLLKRPGAAAQSSA